MPIQYTVLALPRSVAAAADAHVSLFVSPRLTPDGTLADFPPVTRWAAAVAERATAITLTDQTGSNYRITAALPKDPRYWDVVFPPDTPVRGWQTTSLHGRTLQSFPASSGVALAKAVHVASFAASPIEPPPPTANPIATLMDGLARQFGAHVGTHYDESAATGQFDDATNFGQEPLPDEAKAERSPAGALPSDALAGVLGDLHQARRFFERPESVQEYRARPNARSPRLPVPERDFHERLTLLGDQPALLRRLGLIIDLKVEELDRLRDAEWLSARIELADAGDLTLTTSVRCRVSGENLVTVGEDGGDWRDGRLRLGDEQRYAVLDLDADASALKLERFLWTAPRLIGQEAKGEPAHAAPPTLRGHGFAVARAGRARDLAARQKTAATETEPGLTDARSPLLHTEDVTRGMRIEVWDDTAKSWFSLHARVQETQVVGHPDPFTVSNEGWLQGGTVQETQGVKDRRVYVHETLFGWSGWSLSAPHPAMTLEHTYDHPSHDPSEPERNERIVNPAAPDDPPLHVVTVSRVAKGTLPRLRYGRSYALRAWSVDLAGASPAHVLGPTPPPEAPPELLPAVESRLSALPAPAPEPIVDDLASAVRATASVAPRLADSLDTARLTLPVAVEQAVAPAGEEVRALLLARASAAARSLAATRDPGARRLQVTRAVEPLLRGTGPLLAETAGWNPATLTRAIHADGAVENVVAGIDVLLDTVTALRPLLRWHPVDPPVLVPRARYTEGESLRHLVVRSGVTTTRDPELGDTITVTSVDAWLKAGGAARHGVTVNYPATCQRHVAAPKVSQLEAELQGRFDAAMTPTASATDRHKAILVAGREAGSFLDTTIPSLTSPTELVPVKGIALVDPSAPPAGPLPALPLSRGAPLAPGQYVIHDTEEARLPYLPDPMARGVSMVFPDAGHDRPLSPPVSVEGTTADYPAPDGWPDVQPFRLVLGRGHPLAAGVDGRTINVTLAPAEKLRVRLASSIEPDKLEQFGFWRSLPDVIRADPALAEAAADGWLWALSPAEELVFVHAVPKPLRTPRMLMLNPVRADATTRVADAATGVALFGALEVHGPSTERVDIEATWTQQEDDVARPEPDDDLHLPERHAVACTLPILEFEDLVLLGAKEATLTLPSMADLRIHRARHELGDTRHRTIAYRCRATTRFREHFHPALLANPDDRSVLGPVRRVSIPSSARPAKPAVHQVLPMFRWEEETEPEQPFGLRRRRRAGVRIYLDRPWYSSGDGELLGVIIGELPDAGGENAFSQWGADPVWHGRGPQQRAISVELDHLLSGLGPELPARPVHPLVQLPLVDLAQRPSAGVLGYRPEYHRERGLWFVDIAVDPRSAIWPFVRFVVARYQPDSIAGKHLSQPVRCDFVQVPLERTATLTRPDDRIARIVLSGPVGYRGEANLDTIDAATPDGFDAIRTRIGANRLVHARLQRRDPTIASDLAWSTVTEVALRIEGFDTPSLTAAWVGTLKLPEALAPSRPGKDPDWRVAVEETEWLDADRVPGEHSIGGPQPKLPRVVYLDHLVL